MKNYAYSILFILLASVLVAGCTSGINKDAVLGVKSSETPQNETVEATKEQTAPLVKGSYQNPAGVGETIVLSTSGTEFEVTIKEVKRGDDANYLLKSEDELSEKPSTGYEYLLVKANVAYTKGDGPTSIDPYNFKPFCDGVEVSQNFGVALKDHTEFSSGLVMPGAQKEGWIGYIVPTGKEVILSYQTNMFDDGTAYISLGK